MYEEKKIGVVVPAHNEEKLITRVIDTMPDFVDGIYIVDDVSKDNTVQVITDHIAQHNLQHVHLIRHEVNKGAGGSIATGYRSAEQAGCDVIAVMDGDAQMDPTELHRVIEPVVRGECDYVKGNRLHTEEAWRQIPRVRLLGNAALSLMTKIASGYWHILDSQTGYTAISAEAVRTVPWDKLWRRYGYPNHILILLNIYNFRVRNVPVSPVYNIGEKSGIRIWRVIPSISWLLIRGFFDRLVQKYIFRDTHPLVLFYFIGIFTFTTGVLYSLWLFFFRVIPARIDPVAAIIAVFLILFGLNFIMFALWFDMDDNRRLR